MTTLSGKLGSARKYNVTVIKDVFFLIYVQRSRILRGAVAESYRLHTLAFCFNSEFRFLLKAAVRVHIRI